MKPRPKTGERRPRPRTGERRDVRQPFKIDRLPQKMRERIELERASGSTWLEIEALSMAWPEWAEVDAEVAGMFPGRRLPHSNLQRWYDLRVEQVQAQVLAETERARVLANAFKERTFQDLPEAVMNALRDLAFTALSSSQDAKGRKQVAGALSDIAFLCSKLGKLDLDREKLNLDRERVKMAREKLDQAKAKVEALKKDVEKKQVSPAELQQRLDEIYGITA